MQLEHRGEDAAEGEGRREHHHVAERPPGKEEELDKILDECREWYKKKGLI